LDGINVTKNFQEKFLHRAILPGALRADLGSLKSVPDRFLTTQAKARRVAAMDGKQQKPLSCKYRRGVVMLLQS